MTTSAATSVKLRPNPSGRTGLSCAYQEHPRVKSKRLRIPKIRSWKLSMSGVQQHIHSPRIARMEKQSCAPVHPESTRPEIDVRIVSCFRTQFAGRVFTSNVRSESHREYGASIDTRSAGLRFGSWFTNVSISASDREVEAWLTTRNPRLFHRPPTGERPSPARGPRGIAAAAYSPELH